MQHWISGGFGGLASLGTLSRLRRRWWYTLAA